MSDTVFEGFDRSLLDFLDELSRNNNRAWFSENKPRYEALVLGPALDFITDMSPRLAKLSRHFLAIPRRSGGSLMRVYRDTRFAKNMPPYKTNLGIQFRHELGKDVHAPGFYVHAAVDEVFVGVGAWRPDAPALARIRDRIVERGAEWRKARDERRFAAAFELAGERLKRPPRGYPADHPDVEDLKRKDFIAIRHFPTDKLLHPGFIDEVASSFRIALPLMRFLCKSVDVPV